MIAWEPGSDEIGDFTWPGFDSEVVVTDAVFDELRPFSGFDPGPVEVVEDADAPKTRGKRVTVPYRGPRLHELWVTASARLDRDRSSAELEHACPTCDAERWELDGVERWDSYFDRELKQLVRTKTERLPNAGVFVQESDLHGADVFRVRSSRRGSSAPTTSARSSRRPASRTCRSWRWGRNDLIAFSWRR